MHVTNKSDRRLVSNVWYGESLGAEMFAEPTGGVVSAVKTAIVLARAADRDGVIVTTEGSATPVGLVVLAAVSALRGRRQLVVLEFLPGIKSGPRGRLITFLYRRLLHRSAASIQVMTEWESEMYAREYNVPVATLGHIPFFHYNDSSPQSPVAASARSGVFASGRNSCDFDFLIEAARNRSWDLTIVCAASEYEHVRSAAEGSDITVLSEISAEEHDDYLMSARVYVIPLRDMPLSSGHVRIMSAVTFRTPVIVTDVRGVDGYTHLAAGVVPSADPAALRDAVEALLNDANEREAVSVRIEDSAKSRTRTTYLAEIEKLVLDA